MFIDWLSLLLINTVIGYVLLAAYVYSGLDEPEQTRWAPGFLMVGLVAVVFGGVMVLVWPLPGPYNSAFGEMSVLLGIIFLGAGLAMAKGWSLVTVAAYAFFAGWAAIVIGARIVDLKLTLNARLSGLGFILSGLGGVMAAPTLLWLKSSRPWRVVACLVLLAAALIWAYVGFGAYWAHMESFGKWLPPTMPAPAGHP